MAIRREQALCLSVLVLGGLLAWQALGKEVPKRNANPKPKQYEASTIAQVPVAERETSPLIKQHEPDLLREPTESTPLPPRALPLPPLGPAPVVALPLNPGQEPPAWYTLRLSGQPLTEPFVFVVPGGEGGQEAGAVKEASAQPVGGPAAGAGAPAGPAGAPAAQDKETKEQRIARLEQIYDRVEQNNGSEPNWGEVLGKEKYELDGKTVVHQNVKMRWVSPENGKTIRELEIKPEEVKIVVLSKSLRSQIEVRKRRISEELATLPIRAAFLEDLLAAARKDPWVYAAAQEQADLYSKISGGNEDGQRWRARVRAEQGDLDGELKLYQELKGELADSAFKLAGVGRIQAKLGLVADAERSLRAAVEKGRADPRPHVALAKFLIARGRAAEALPHCEAAQRNKGVLDKEPREVFELTATLLRAQLALGNLDGAKDAFSKLDTSPSFSAQRDLLKGCLEYADGKRDNAAQVLQAASDGTMLATLGQAACLLAVADPAAGKWADCKKLLESVRDGEPLLRQDAHAGLALMYERTGHLPEALVAAEAAYAAAPRDPYVQYILGRERRLSAQPELATEVLSRLLRTQDLAAEPCVELALAELALGQAQSGDEIDRHFARAIKLIDRAVELDEAHAINPWLYEVQGLIGFEAGDLRMAQAAFAKGAEKNSIYCKIGLAIVAYAQNNIEEALGMLSSIAEKQKAGQVRTDVTNLINQINEWSSREQIRETFDRGDLKKGEKAELSKKWVATGTPKPALQDNALRIVGESTGGKPVVASRQLDTAGNFLRCEVRLTAAGNLNERFAGLVVADEGKPSGQLTIHDFAARLGIKDGKPYLRIEESGAANPQLSEPVELPDTCRFEPGKPVPICLEVEPRKEGDSAFVLRCYWDGALVHQRDVSRLSKNSRGPLLTNLTVDGTSRVPVDVAFDDYRLVRRRDTK